MNTYQEVKEKRQKLGITIYKLSELTGIKQQTISLGEQRNSRLSVESQNMFENAFKKYVQESKISGNSINQRVAGNNNYVAGKDVTIKSSKSDEVQQLKEQIKEYKKTINDQNIQIHKLIDIISKSK